MNIRGREEGVMVTCRRSFSSIGSHFFVLFGLAASYAHLLRWRAMDERDASKPKAAGREGGGGGVEGRLGTKMAMSGGGGDYYARSQVISQVFDSNEQTTHLHPKKLPSSAYVVGDEWRASENHAELGAGLVGARSHCSGGACNWGGGGGQADSGA